MGDSNPCKHNSTAPVSVLHSLPINQGGSGRHKCARCAYKFGYTDGKRAKNIEPSEGCPHLKKAPIGLVEGLHESQAGSGRHKCAICSYAKGYRDGLAKKIYKEILKSDAHLLERIGNIKQTTPPPFRARIATREPQRRKTAGKVVNYSDEESKKKEIGYAGELLVIKYETDFLIENGRSDLAKQVLHVSKIEGDSAGYDVMSFDLEGKKIYIEVKTTVGSDKTPFLISSNELAFAKSKDQYYIYRIYDFNKKNKRGRFYIVHGDPEKKFNLIPTEFRASRS